MKIRRANNSDIARIKDIYREARIYMAEHGNPNQWEIGYPSDDIIREDIESGNAYVMENESEISGVFVFIIGEDPTYQVIKDGSWHADHEYGTIHRIASSGQEKGIAKQCFDYCISQIDYLRIDTHEKNRSMQSAIQRYGFQYCGKIYVRNGERIAFDYQRVTIQKGISRKLFCR